MHMPRGAKSWHQQCFIRSLIQQQINIVQMLGKLLQIETIYYIFYIQIL